MSLFIKNKNNDLVNGLYISNIDLDITDKTKVVWYMTNGETYIEQFNTEAEATSRKNLIKAELKAIDLGSDEEEINALKAEVTELNTQIDTLNTEIEDLNTEVDELTTLAQELNS